MKQLFKASGKHLVALLIFLGLVTVYFYPAVFEGKIIFQSDNEKAFGMGGSQMAQYEKTAAPGEFSVWSDAMFGGMPYITGYGKAAPDLPSYTLLETPIKKVGYYDAAMVFAGLVAFYILMCIMGVSWWLAIAGSIAFAFASYNIIIIKVGHIVKAYVIAYMPLTLAGMFLLFKRNYIWGIFWFLLGIALSVSNGHIQITYYLALFCLFIFLGYAYNKIRNKQISELMKVTGIMIACVILAVLPNAKKMYADWDLSRHSTRGATELTLNSGEKKVSSGLDQDYAFEWSYAKGELLTFLIPNVYGGSSGGFVGNDSQLYKELRAHGAQVSKEIQTYTYWGNKAFTEGPVYFGAIICFLFVLGMFVIRNPIKWWILAGGIFLTFMALGKHLFWFNDILFHYLPMYNKFRTVEMALVIPGLIFPVIGIWGLTEILSGKTDEALLKKGWIVSLSLTGGICLIIWLLPDLFLSFQSDYDKYYGLPDWYLTALISDRASLASSDAFRSLIFILLGAGLIYWFIKAKNKKQVGLLVSIGITILTLADFWTVDKRYINDSNFIKKKHSELYTPGVADQEILKDTDPSFRVLNLNNPFQETNTSYFHKSIGGYHAAKLGRYQELIDYRLGKEINGIIESLQTATSNEEIYNTLERCYSLNMLNTRYIIYNPDQPPLLNPFAYGNAWFVKNLEIVENADAEILSLDRINPQETAVIDKRFEEEIKNFTPVYDENASITLDSYRPNKLIYTFSASSPQLTIFSDIYYQPGWRAFIDDKPVSHFRTDWTLRGMIIPAGEHQIIFEFYPEAYIKAAYVESYSSFFILLLLLGIIGYSLWKKNKEKPIEIND